MPTAEPPYVDIEVVDGVATLTLDDPARRNALSTPMVDLLHAAADRDDVHAFVVTGRGGDFCAGADVAELASGAWRGAEPVGPPVLFRRVTEDPRPWIAAVDGRALGGGAELALSCDFLVLSPSATLRLPESGLGVVPNTATRLLALGLPRSLRLAVLLGLVAIDADRAVDLGLALAAYPPQDLVDEACTLARTVLARTSPTAFALLKSAVAAEEAPSWTDVARLLAACDARDVDEGIGAMRERRRLDFTSRW